MMKAKRGLHAVPMAGGAQAFLLPCPALLLATSKRLYLALSDLRHPVLRSTVAHRGPRGLPLIGM
jgi:hypothetical protein